MMRQLVQSTSLVVCLALLTVMTTVNTCQLDAVERQVQENNRLLRQIEQGGVVTRAEAPESPAVGRAGLGTLWFSEAEREALDDPKNLLKVPLRPFVDPARVVRGGTLRRQTGADPRGMNSYIANGGDVAELARFVQNRLANRDPAEPDRFSPELAVKVVTPDDGLSYIVTLREGVMWHEPQVDWASGRYEWLRGPHELVADDYAFVFEAMRNSQVTGRISSMRSYFDSVKSVDVLDDHTFRVVYDKRQAINLPQLLDLEPLPRWLFQYDEDGKRFDESTWGLALNEHWYNQRMMGTGPYRFLSWEPGVKIELERNTRYWGETPPFERVLIAILGDQATWVRKLKAKELDYTQLQPEQYRTEILEGGKPYLGEEDLELRIHDTLAYFFLGWNQDTPFFGDKRVRQAMTLAMNREGIVANVFNGLGEVTSGPFALQHPCYDRSIEPWPFDLDAAAARLDEAGWIDRDGDGIREKTIDGEVVPFDFSMLIYGSSTEYETLASIYREDLLSVGVKMTPVALEWSTMLKKMDEREFDVFTGAWILAWEIDLFQLWHSTEADRPKSSNRIGMRSPEADRIAEALRDELDEDKRLELCRSFHAFAHEEQPYTFIYQRTQPVLYWDWMNEPTFPLLYPYRDLRYMSFHEARP